MASKTNIGAVIGVEGARQYNTDMANIIAKTKTLKAEYKELTSAFDKNRTSWKNIVDSSKKLGEQAEATAKKLKIQTDALKEMQEKGKGANQTWDQYYQALEKQAEAVNRTQAEYNDLINTINDLPSKLQFAADKINTISSGLKPIGSFMTRAVTLPIVGAMTAAVKTAIDWETAFIGVKKTTDEIIDDNDNVIYSYERLEEELKELTKYTASDFATIFKTAEISGQMGIRTNEIPEFVKYMIAMGDATNLASEEAASYIATTLNLMNKGMPIMAKQAKQVGDAIVYLGNKYNTAEADIAHMTARLAPGAALVNMTTADVLALATAMSEAKITPEGGGTAMTQVLQKIHKSFANFTKGAESDLPKIARVAGMSADDFAKTWQREPIKALEAFIGGLGKLNDEGEYTALVLDDLGMAGIRQNLTMSALSLTSKRLSDAIRDSNKEFENGNALLDEASQFWDSSEGKMVQFKNAMANLGNSFGKEVLPYITDFVEKLTDLINKFAELPEDSKKNIMKFLLAVALIGPSVKTFTGVSDAVSGILTSIDKLNKKGGLKGIADGFKGIGDAINGGGALAGGKAAKGIFSGLTAGNLAIGGILGGLGALIVHFATNEEEARKFGDEVNRQLGGAAKDWDTYGVTVSTVLDETGAYAMDSIGKTSLELKNKTSETTTALNDSFNSMKNNTTTALTETSKTASSSFDKIKADSIFQSTLARRGVKKEFDNLSNDVTTSTNNLTTLLPTKYQSMASSLKTEGEGIRKQFKLVMTGVEDEATRVDLFTAGKHMMESLKSGINAAKERVVSAAIGVAKRIRDNLMFSVPKEGPLSDFDKAMPDMMKLMAKGINDNAYLVDDAIDNVARGIANNSYSNTTNYGGVVVNLNVPQGANGRELVDQIEQELIFRMNSERLVFNQ